MSAHNASLNLFIIDSTCGPRGSKIKDNIGISRLYVVWICWIFSMLLSQDFIPKRYASDFELRNNAPITKILAMIVLIFIIGKIERWKNGKEVWLGRLDGRGGL